MESLIPFGLAPVRLAPALMTSGAFNSHHPHTMFSKPQMTHLSRELQAEKAIAHTLQNIAERPPVAYYLGHGTQTYALLTEALATLSGKGMDEIQAIYQPASPRVVGPEELGDCPFCGSHHLRIAEDTCDAWVECGDCNARGPEASTFRCDEDEALQQAARRKWLNRKMPR